jgi:hypothetical protein
MIRVVDPLDPNRSVEVAVVVVVAVAVAVSISATTEDGDVG